MVLFLENMSHFLLVHRLQIPRMGMRNSDDPHLVEANRMLSHPGVIDLVDSPKGKPDGAKTRRKNLKRS